MNTSTDTLMQSLGKIVKQRRLALGMSQQELAKATGLTPSFIREVEKDFAIGFVYRLSEVLKLPFSEISKLVEQAARLAAVVEPAGSSPESEDVVRADFSADKIVAILQAAEAGADSAELSLTYGISPQTFAAWKSLYGGRRLSEVRRLRASAVKETEAPAKQKPEPLTAASALVAMGDRALRERNLALAEQLFGQALKEAEAALGQGNVETLPIQVRIADTLAAQKRLSEAEQLYRQVLAGLDDLTGTKEALFVMVLLSLAELCEARGDREAALDLRLKAKPIFEWYSEERFPVLDTHDTSELLDLLLGVVQVISHSSNRAQLVRDCLETICKAKDWQVGEAWFPDEDGAWVCKEMVTNTSLDLGSLRQITLGAHFANGLGLPGHVSKTGGAYWSEDISLDSQVPRASVAVDCGLTAAVAFPVRRGQELLSVFSFFFQEDRQVDQTPLYILDELGACIGAVLARLISD